MKIPTNICQILGKAIRFVKPIDSLDVVAVLNALLEELEKSHTCLKAWRRIHKDMSREAGQFEAAIAEMLRYVWRLFSPLLG